MIDSMRAHKEQADAILELLRRHASTLPMELYDRLYAFVKAARARLPRCETLLRDLEKKANRINTRRKSR